MADYLEGSKRQVAELKFLIHDLRVEKFINNIIHFHVTLNTDLEIYNIEQAQAMHTQDLQELKDKAVQMRKALQNYANAVHSFSPEKTIIVLGRQYIDTVFNICQLILNPLWGRSDKVLSFLPPEARSVQSRSHYRNSIRWICGVYYRIKHFYDELNNVDFYHEFNLAEEVYYYTRNVIYGYATEKSSSRVELILEHLESVAVAGNLYRFRRTFFNLVMNSVDALSDKKVGVIKISVIRDKETTRLVVADDGSGMPQEKIDQLLAERNTLDGELHSLGFVFVRQTIKDFGGSLDIQSSAGEGTQITIYLPILDKTIRGRELPKCEQYTVETEYDMPNLQIGYTDLDIEDIQKSKELKPAGQGQADTQGKDAAAPKESSESGTNEKQKDDSQVQERAYGKLVYEDYQNSQSQFPGAIFAMGVTPEGRVDFFTHRGYEKYWNISHEDLSPMYFEATVRGRLEENESKEPELILKAPINRAEYYSFRELDLSPADVDSFIRLVHDEYIQIARKLIQTGMDGGINVHVTDIGKFFSDHGNIFSGDPFPLTELAEQPLFGEQEG